MEAAGQHHTVYSYPKGFLMIASSTKPMCRFLTIVCPFSLLRGMTVLVVLVFPFVVVNVVNASGKADLPSAVLSNQNKSPGHGAQSEGEREKKLRDDIQQYRTVEASAPGTTSAKEASVNEARALIALGSKVDLSEKQRRRDLAKSLSTNFSIPEGRRFEVVAGVANVEVASDVTLNRAQKLEQFATVARSLIHDFPGQMEAYASLLRIARDSDQVAASKIAHELLQYAGTPAQVQEGARTLLRRLDLIGLPVDQFFSEPSSNGNRPKETICIYSWSASSPRSIILGSTLEKIAPENAWIIAICVDTDTAAAKESVAKLGVVSDQLVFSGGIMSDICQKLCLDEPSLAYITDKNGRLLSIAALNWLAASNNR